MQNRFITFDERMMPGPGYQSEGLFFDQHAHHNIPGYLDNVMVHNLPGPYWDCASNFRLEILSASLQDPVYSALGWAIRF